MTARNFVAAGVIALVWVLGMPETTRAADCIYAIALPASGGGPVATIVQADGSGAVNLEVAGGPPSAIVGAVDGTQTFVGVTTVAQGCPDRSSVVAISSNGEQRTLLLSRPGSLGSLAVHPGGKVIYAVDNLASRLFVINASTLTMVSVLPLKNATGSCPDGADALPPQPVGMQVSPDGSRLLITTSTCGLDCRGTLTIVQTDPPEIVAEISNDLGRIGFAPDSSRAYFSFAALARIALFDLGSNAVIDTFPVEANDLATAPDGVFALTPTNIRVLNPQTNTVKREIDLRGRLIAVAPNSDRAYVASSTGRTEVVVLEASTGQTLGRVPLENPSWLAAGVCPQNDEPEPTPTATPDDAVGSGGGSACNLQPSRPTWWVMSLLVVGLGVLVGRRRARSLRRVS